MPADGDHRFIEQSPGTGLPIPSLLDAKEAGALLNVPASWVLAEARADRIPHVRLGRYVRFAESLRFGSISRTGLVKASDVGNNMTGGRLGRELPGQAELSAGRVGVAPAALTTGGHAHRRGTAWRGERMPRGRDMPAHAHPMRACLVLLATACWIGPSILKRCYVPRAPGAAGPIGAPRGRSEGGARYA